MRFNSQVSYSFRCCIFRIQLNRFLRKLKNLQMAITRDTLHFVFMAIVSDVCIRYGYPQPNKHFLK